MKRIQPLCFLFITLLFFPVVAHAQLSSGVLDPTRAIDWTSAGAGAIPTYAQCGPTITAYNGTTDRINNALAGTGSGYTGCAPPYAIVLGSGTFNLAPGGATGNGITIYRSRVALRGQGANSTFLVFGRGALGGCDGLNPSICLISPPTGGGPAYADPQAPYNTGNWTAGYSQGATTITISQTGGTTAPFVGASMFLLQRADGRTRASDTNQVFYCTQAPDCTQAGQAGIAYAEWEMVTVTSVSGSGPYTLGISPGLYAPNWSSGHSPQVQWPNAVFSTGMGLENLSVDSSANTGATPAVIAAFSVQNSWVRRVRVVQVAAPANWSGNTNRRIKLESVHNFTIRDSYLVGKAGRDDYGIDYYIAFNNLAENNIIQNVGTPLITELGSGNVWSYNFTVNNNWGSNGGCSPHPTPCWMQGSIYGHSTDEHYALAEGNIAFGQEFENYFGHGFFITAFRNLFFGMQQSGNTNQGAQTVPVFVYGLNRYFNFVGNVLGFPGFHTTYQSVGGRSSANCQFSIYAIGYGGNCAPGNGVSSPLDDTLVANTSLTTLLRWANYDTVTGANRFCGNSSDTGWSTTCGSTSEVPTGITPYSNAVPTKGDTGAGQSTLPASWVYASQPAWWPNGKAWPPIGPDVTSGNVGTCTGGSYSSSLALSGGQCTGGAFAVGWNSHAVSIPAMDCYLNTMGGNPNGTTGDTINGRANTPLAFDATACYGGSFSSQGPNAPTNIVIVVN